MIVFGVLLVIVGVTATAQVLMVSVHSSSVSLNAIVQSDTATLRGFLHQGTRAGLDASIADAATADPAQQQQLSELMSTLVAKGGILRVDLRAVDGRVVASSEPMATGSVVVAGPEFAAVSATNQAHVDIVAAEAADTGARLATTTVLREYLPLSQNGQVLLVIAVYRDAMPVLTSLDDLRREVVLVIISGAAIAAGVLFLVFRAAQGRISRQTAALVEATRRDPLTEMLNHGALVGFLAEETERARASGRSVDVALLDIDNLRLLNDNHGHRAGDQALLTVARVLAQQLPPEMVMGRYGPDEFLVIRPATAEPSLGPAIERVRLALRSVGLEFDGTERMPITFSAGLCAYPEHASSVTVLLSVAARTLEEAKASGGDAVCVAGARSESEVAATSSFDVLQGLVFAVDTKDRYTRRHSQDVARYAVFLGERLGLPDEMLRSLHISGLLHDVGKIGIPDHILRKPGRLTGEEAAIVRQHVALGDMIVRELPDVGTVRAGIRHHHERWDGRGYLTGLGGQEIPLVARILSVADAFSAMTTTRPYRKAFDVTEALRRLGDAAGSQLDEDLVRAFILGLETVPNAPLPNVDVPVSRLWVPRLIARPEHGPA